MGEYLSMTVGEVSAAIGMRRKTELVRSDGEVEVSIFHESASIAPLEASPAFDGHLFSLLLYCMKRGLPLRVRGPLTRSCLWNINEFQHAWTKWKPDTYQCIEIIPDDVISAPRKATGKAISAFSGGADATFSALMHRRVLPEPLRYPLTDVLMVHGFDVDLAEPKYFDDLKLRTAPLLDELRLRLRTVKTNSKDWTRQKWDDSFAIELAACLHIAGHDCQYGLIGSSEPYDGLVLPWGSSPVTDYLLSGDAMTIVHDGAGFSRTEKISEIAKHSTARRTLKVCWAGDNQAENCGTCEKCIRTMLNFKATGNTIPECFPGGLNLEDIKHIKVYSTPQMAELNSIVEYAQRSGIEDADWIRAVRRRIRAGYSSYGPTGIRAAVGQISGFFGVKETLKSLLALANIR